MLTRAGFIKFFITLVLLAPFIFLYLHRGRDATSPPASPALLLSLSSTTLPAGPSSTPAITEKPDPYALFIVEAYDKIMQTHWKARSEGEMLDLFLPAYTDAIATTTKKIEVSSYDRTGFILFLISDFIPRREEEKRRIAVATITDVLAHLEPLGRNSLMSKREVVELRDRVSNIDPKKDLYADVGVPKGAPPEEVTQKFEEKKVVLEASSTPEAKVELEKITYAKDVLTNVETKARYDTRLIEPTVFGHQIGDDLLYIYMSKIAPTTVEEFGEAIARASSTPGLDHLVIDLRKNIGGALDFPSAFFGAYVGTGLPALEVTHQNATFTEETKSSKMPGLARYTTQVVIIDKGTQSTAEVVAAFYKKKKLALVIGDTTAGWGSVENTYPMQASIDPNVKYSLFLVNSLTLADDGKPIQGRGVTPNINVTELDWQDKLKQYFEEDEIVSTLWRIMSAPPER